MILWYKNQLTYLHKKSIHFVLYGKNIKLKFATLTNVRRNSSKCL